MTFCVISLLVSLGASSSEPLGRVDLVQWERTFEEVGDNGYVRHRFVFEANDGCHLVLRSHASDDRRMNFMKLSSEGDVVWTRTLSGDVERSGSMAVPAGDGGYMIGGRSLERDAWCLIKTNAEGVESWSRECGGGVSMYFGLCSTRDGGYVFTAPQLRGTNARDFLIVKTKADAEIVWSRLYGSRDDEFAYFVVESRESGFFVGGWARPDGKPSQHVGLIRKVGENGDDQWCRRFPLGSGFGPLAAQALPGGGIVAVGPFSREEPHQAKTGIAFLCMGEEGNTKWLRELAQPANVCFGVCAVPARDGGFIVAANLRANERPKGSQMYLIKADAEGREVWTISLGPDDGTESEVSSIQETADGGVIVVGGLSRAEPQDSKFTRVVKFRPPTPAKSC